MRRDARIAVLLAGPMLHEAEEEGAEKDKVRLEGRLHWVLGPVPSTSCLCYMLLLWSHPSAISPGPDTPRRRTGCATSPPWGPCLCFWALAHP